MKLYEVAKPFQILFRDFHVPAFEEWIRAVLDAFQILFRDFLLVELTSYPRDFIEV